MIKKIWSANSTGKVAEDVAATYLLEQNLNIIARNFHCRFGEIDLIAIDKNILVFIEVRYRKNEQYLTALETIDKNKCHKIITTGNYYLSQHKTYRHHQCRFDTVTITGDLNKSVIEWIKNAFQA